MQSFEPATAPGAAQSPNNSNNSGNRSTIGWVLGCGVVGVVALLLLCGGGLAAIFFGVFSLLKSSEPYTRSFATVKGAAQVQQILGEPIEEGWFPTGSINLNNNAGTADLSYTVSGPKGSATVNLEATRKNGRWQFNNLIVTPNDGGQQIELTEVVNDTGASEDPT